MKPPTRPDFASRVGPHGKLGTIQPRANQGCPGCSDLFRLVRGSSVMTGYLARWAEGVDVPATQLAGDQVTRNHTARSNQDRLPSEPHSHGDEAVARVSSRSGAAHGIERIPERVKSEISRLLAIAFVRWSRIRRVSDNLAPAPSDPSLANSCAQSVHGVVP
jgi:hypothetical protein